MIGPIFGLKPFLNICSKKSTMHEAVVPTQYVHAFAGELMEVNDAHI